MSNFQSPRAELGITFPDSDDTHLGMDNSSENYNSLPNVPQELEMNTVSVVPDDSFTIRQAINTYGFGKFQAKLSLFTGLCWMADSMEMTILSIITPALHCTWNMPRYQQALLTMVVFLGMMISSRFWELVGDRYGRKKALMTCAFLLIFCGMASSLSTSFIWMFMLRGLVGFTVGCVPQSVTLYAEYLPSKQRAKCVVLLDCFWALGACFEVVLALLLMPSHGWSWLLLFSTAPIIAFACITPWLPESAKFHMIKGNPEQAYSILRSVANDNNKSMLVGRLVMEDSSNEETGKISDLFLPHLRNISLRLWLIWATCSFCYYGLVLLSTELLTISRRHSHLNATTGTFDTDCVMLDTQDYMDLLWTTFAEFPGILMTVFVIEKCGHKNTMAMQFGLFSLCCVLLTVTWTQRLTLIPLLIIARGVIAGVFQAAYLYTPEVYPSGLRSVGLSTCSVFARLGAVFTPFVSQISPSLLAVFRRLASARSRYSLYRPDDDVFTSKALANLRTSASNDGLTSQQVLLHVSLTAGIGVYVAVAVVSAITSILLPYEKEIEKSPKTDNKST